jgi:hypothetical protein
VTTISDLTLQYTAGMRLPGVPSATQGEARSLKPGDLIVFASVGTVATLCCFASDTSGQRYAVTRAPQRAMEGDRVELPSGVGGTPGNVIGTIFHLAVPNSVMRVSGNDNVAIALIKLDQGIGIDAASSLRPSGTGVPKIGEKVTVVTSSGPLQSTIEATNAGIFLGSDFGQILRLSDTFSFSAQTKPGDGGAAVIDTANKKLVGYVIGAYSSPPPPHCYALPIEPALKGFGVTLVMN